MQCRRRRNRAPNFRSAAETHVLIILSQCETRSQRAVQAASGARAGAGEDRREREAEEGVGDKCELRGRIALEEAGGEVEGGAGRERAEQVTSVHFEGLWSGYGVKGVGSQAPIRRWKGRWSLGIWHCDEEGRIMSLQMFTSWHRRTVLPYIHCRKHLLMPPQRR